MRARNVLTQTNDMRKLMGLPLLTENGGNTIKDIKKKVLNESEIEYEDDQWLVIEKDNEDDEEIEELDETTSAEATEKESIGAPVNDMVREDKDDSGISSTEDTTYEEGVLKNGSTGPEVKKLQNLLNITVDGNFGTTTEAAVKKYQQNNGIAADGIVGPETWAKLEGGERQIKESVTDYSQYNITKDLITEQDQAVRVKIPMGTPPPLSILKILEKYSGKKNISAKISVSGPQIDIRIDGDSNLYSGNKLRPGASVDSGGALGWLEVGVPEDEEVEKHPKVTPWNKNGGIVR